MTEPSTDVRGRPHLPKEPIKTFRAFFSVCRNETLVFLREVEKNITGFEDADTVGVVDLILVYE